MTVLRKMDGKRIWQHIYYDTARRTEHILSLFSDLAVWEEELVTEQPNKDNVWAYERNFTVKATPKMLRLGSYRNTRFSGRYGQVVSTPTKAQREMGY